MLQATAEGRRIEAASFAIVDAEAGAHGLAPAEWSVARRVIHATADFDFQRALAFSPGAVAAGAAALRAGCLVLCDVRMILGGLNAARLAALGCSARCLLDVEGVAEAARAAGTTRAAAAMRLAGRAGWLDGAVVAIGNAPTALAELSRLCAEEGARPALVIGVPVGFVGAAESKEAALALPVPHVVARGRKGGSPVAVAVIHALAGLAAEEGTCAAP
ncbi:MAG TPA: precorrin-8X methylmutase [Anaeromyxobacteraceae bacterium]|nr:precorrin-8X methylmutase [Anaeromyxobacteraceae bacterium]